MEEKITENAAKLIQGTLDDTSLLALAIGQAHLRQQCRVPDEASIGGPAKSVSSVELGATLASIDQTTKALLAKFGGLTPGRSREKEKRIPEKRDTVIFAAILGKLKGMKYCSFLKDHNIRPNWSDPDPATYPSGYQAGNPWRKKNARSKSTVPLITQLEALLERHRRASGNPASGPIFANGVGKALDLDSLYRRQMKEPLQQAGIEWEGWHGFRRGLAQPRTHWRQGNDRGRDSSPQ